MESGQDAAEALEPAAQGCSVVALAAKRVGAGNAVMDMRRDRLQRLIPATVVDVVGAGAIPGVPQRSVIVRSP